MPEQLKPCPACGGDGVVGRSPDLRYVKVICKKCGTSTGYFLTPDTAIAAWNSMPSALRWTHEPPKVAGIFLAESTLDNCSKKITPIEVFSSDHWRHSDWEKRHGKLSCLLCLGGFGVCPVSKYSRFAGPIPTPLEPGES